MPTATSSGPVTALLVRWSDGDLDALEELFRLVYAELRTAAGFYLQNERPSPLLQPTELVQEVCLKILARRKVSWQNRRQFFGFAGQVLRRLLVDIARLRDARKRGRDIEILPLTGTQADQPRALDPPTLLSLHDALDQLATIDQRAAKVVELRYFAGMSIAETARALEISIATAKRDWKIARKFLAIELKK